MDDLAWCHHSPPGTREAPSLAPLSPGTTAPLGSLTIRSLPAGPEWDTTGERGPDVVFTFLYGR
jgi:hypothetical protein